MCCPELRTKYKIYSRINSTQSPASLAGDVSEPRLMSQVRVDQRVSVIGVVEVLVIRLLM